LAPDTGLPQRTFKNVKLGALQSSPNPLPHRHPCLHHQPPRPRIRHADSAQREQRQRLHGLARFRRAVGAYREQADQRAGERRPTR
jgi:hypothetical protein